LIKDLNSLLGEQANRFTCMSESDETYFNAHAEDFISYIQIRHSDGRVVQKNFWTDERSRNYNSKGKTVLDFSPDCQSGYSCVALVSFLAGQSKDAKKKMLPCNRR